MRLEILIMLNLKITKDKPFKDYRGYYWTSWKKNSFNNKNFCHDKFSYSKYRVLRGLHGDSKTWKLISCVYGKFFFVVVNYDRKSKNYLKTLQTTLTMESGTQILIPPNFLNGMMCLSKECVMHYKLAYKGRYTDHDKQISIKWNDIRLKIKWPNLKPILSKRDV